MMMRERRSACLRQASNSELEAARATLLSIRRAYESGQFASTKVELKPLRETFLMSLAQPEFVTSLLVQMLRLSASSTSMPVEGLMQLYGFTVEK